MRQQAASSTRLLMNETCWRAGGRKLLLVALVVGFGMFPGVRVLFAQGTALTYQGRLQDGGTAANANYDFQFTLWDALNGGLQQPQPAPVTVTRTGVSVANGVFTTQLDFGANAFPGADRYLEISVRLAGAAPFTILSPRQQINGTPYAIRSVSAAAADSATNATQLGGVAAGQYVLTSDARLTDARPPTAGSWHYIQNNAGQQAVSNFNIDGMGTANVFNAINQFALGGSRVLSDAGEQNLFAGHSAGIVNTGGQNSVFGSGAGWRNTTGSANSFFGRSAGQENTTGFSNSFFGANAGLHNTTGQLNSFFGENAGSNNTTGSYNTYIGQGAGGTEVNINTTAIGYRAYVSQNNSLVLGGINGVNGATANTNVGIGTTAPSNRLHVVGSFNSTATPMNHIALIENSSTGTSPDVLALKIGRATNPDSSNNFITFFKGDDTSAGAIQGNGNGGVVLAGPGADYAEWLPRLDPNEKIAPGDVVGVFNGRVSKLTNGASQVMVASTGAIVAGNDPGSKARATHSLVAFIGQAMVRVVGPVQAGDFIVPSGNADGFGRAVAPNQITDKEFEQVLGQAWESSSISQPKQLRVVVGLIRPDPALKRVLARQATQINSLEQKITELEALVVSSASQARKSTASNNEKSKK